VKTRRMAPGEMDRRVARFAEIEPTEFLKDVVQAEEAAGIDPEALDLMEFGHSRHLLTIIGLESGDTAITRNAPIIGAGGMTMTYALCPPGTGPPLHAHRVTFETFTVLQGTFELTYNDDGSESLILKPFDVISIPPEIVRTFRNVSDEDGILQVIITGGVHDRGDLDFAEQVGDTLQGYSDETLRYFEGLGFTFTARDGAPSVNAPDGASSLAPNANDPIGRCGDAGRPTPTSEGRP
jgi:quercetin dioxygenase-like cupin family protein